MPRMNIYYFGCVDRAGHYLFTPRGEVDYARIRSTPWPGGVDGVLCPAAHPWRDNQPEGVAKLHHKDGWTALAFWDRSVDRRPNSNSVFLVDATLTFEQMVVEATANFPKVFARFGFPIVNVSPDSIVGKLAYWKSAIRGEDGTGHVIYRRGVILKNPVHGTVTVMLSKDIDPYCPPEDEGKLLALEAGRWKLAPG